MYHIYYHLPTCNLYLSSKDSCPSDSLDRLNTLLKKIKGSDDSVYIYLSDRRLRVEFCTNESNLLIFEIHDSSKAGIFEKSYQFDEIPYIINNFSNIVKNPELYDFELYYW